MEKNNAKEMKEGMGISNESSDEEIRAFLEARRESREKAERKAREAKRLEEENAKRRLEEQRLKEEAQKRLKEKEEALKQLEISSESSDEEIRAFLDARKKMEEEKRKQEEALKREEEGKIGEMAESVFRVRKDTAAERKGLAAAGAGRSSIFTALFLLLVLGSYAYAYQKNGPKESGEDIKGTAEKFIKDNLVQPGTDFKVTDFKKDGDVYKMSVSVAGQETAVYITEDGRKLFLQAIDMNKEPGADAPAAAPVPKAEASTKKDIPDVELFVMSLCPYGIQAEKGILPVVEKLGSKINFAVKFVDYTLHGKKEFDENLKQYCIQKEEPEKFNDYLACFAKEGDSEKCSTEAKIDKSKIGSCVDETDARYKLTENFKEGNQSSPFGIYKDLNDKYGIQGSPSLVVNGQLLEAGRDSASLMKTICSGFENQPEECKTDLPSKNPSPGFGS